jgi:hypothetical protein
MMRQIIPTRAKAGATETPSETAHPRHSDWVQVPWSLRPNASVDRGAISDEDSTIRVVMNGTGCPSASVTTGVMNPLIPLYCNVREDEPAAPPGCVRA